MRTMYNKDMAKAFNRYRLQLIARDLNYYFSETAVLTLKEYAELHNLHMYIESASFLSDKDLVQIGLKLFRLFSKAYNADQLKLVKENFSLCGYAIIDGGKRAII